jgi:hypothetical protein
MVEKFWWRRSVARVFSFTCPEQELGNTTPLMPKEAFSLSVNNTGRSGLPLDLAMRTPPDSIGKTYFVIGIDQLGRKTCIRSRYSSIRYVKVVKPLRASFYFSLSMSNLTYQCHSCG